MIKYLILLFFHFNFLIAQIGANLIASGFDQPLYITNYPNDNNMILVVEQDGIIQIIKNMKKVDVPFLDISDRVHQTWYPADE